VQNRKNDEQKRTQQESILLNQEILIANPDLGKANKLEKGGREILPELPPANGKEKKPQ